jgi:hypothetical protein
MPPAPLQYFCVLDIPVTLFVLARDLFCYSKTIALKGTIVGESMIHYVFPRYWLRIKPNNGPRLHRKGEWIYRLFLHEG